MKAGHLLLVVTVGVLCFGIWMYFLEVVDLGPVMAFLVLQDGITYMFQNLGGVIPDVHQGVASIERLLDLLDYPMEQDWKGTKSQPLNNEVTISGKNLSFQYNEENGKVNPMWESGCCFYSLVQRLTAAPGKEGAVCCGALYNARK